MIEVVLASQRFRFLLRRQDLVEAVLADDGHLPLAVVHFVLAQELHDLGTNC